MILRPPIWPQDSESVAELASLSRRMPMTVADVERRLTRQPEAPPLLALVAERDGALVGFVRCFQAGDDAQRFHIELFVHPSHRRRGVGRALEEAATRFAATHQAGSIFGMAVKDEPDGEGFADAHGWRRVGLLIASRLSLREFRAELPAPAGVQLASMAELGHDAWMDRAFDCYRESDRDTPMIDLIGLMDRATFDRLILSHSSYRPDGFWVAISGQTVVGVSVLLPMQRDDLTRWATDFTGVRREWRGRGLSAALKTAALSHIQSLGGETVETMNNDVNPAMLAVNRRLGFVPFEENWELLKEIGPLDLTGQEV